MEGKEIILDGITYELKRKIPEPKFKINDAIIFKKNRKDIYRISHLSSDRYFLNNGEDYLRFIEQDECEVVGKFDFVFVENAE